MTIKSNHLALHVIIKIDSMWQNANSKNNVRIHTMQGLCQRPIYLWRAPCLSLTTTFPLSVKQPVNRIVKSARVQNDKPALQANGALSHKRERAGDCAGGSAVPSPNKPVLGSCHCVQSCLFRKNKQALRLNSSVLRMERWHIPRWMLCPAWHRISSAMWSCHWWLS